MAWLDESHAWPVRATVDTVEASREIDGKTTTARRFYITSAPLSAKQFAAASPQSSPRTGGAAIQAPPGDVRQGSFDGLNKRRRGRQNPERCGGVLPPS